MEDSEGDITQEQRKERQAIAATMASFDCPERLKRWKVPTETTTQSKIYENIVRAEKLEPEKCAGKATKEVLGLFFCLTSKACREARTKIRLASKSTSSSSDYLRGIHKMESKATEQIQQS